MSRRSIFRLGAAGAALALLPLGAWAQRVLLRENVAADTIRTTFGPNRAYFSHLYFGYGFLLGASSREGAQVRYGASAEPQVGLRNKWRLTQHLALGLDGRYARPVYYLAQNSCTSASIWPCPSCRPRHSCA
jgi:hypothetical protein